MVNDYFSLLFIGFCLILTIECCARTRPITTTTVAPTTSVATTAATTTLAVTTTTVATTTTTMATTTTIPVCVAPDGTAGLTIDTGVTTVDTGSEQTATDHCTSCDAGDRNFYPGTMDPDPTNAVVDNMLALTVNCPTTMFCMCNANKCCQPMSGATVPDRVQFIPFCPAAGGACQMYAVLSQGSGGSPTAFSCDDGTSFTIDQQYPMGTFLDLDSGGYFDAESVSCNNCMNIKDDMCIGPPITGPA